MISWSVVIVPIGKVSQDLLHWTRAALAERLDLDVTLGDSLPLSAAWYDGERRQYRGREILRALP